MAVDNDYDTIQNRDRHRRNKKNNKKQQHNQNNAVTTANKTLYVNNKTTINRSDIDVPLSDRKNINESDAAGGGIIVHSLPRGKTRKKAFRISKN